MAKKEIQKRLLLCAAAFIFGIAFVFAGGLTACNDVSDKIEILEEPKMTMGSNDFFGYFPVISVKIRNKTNSIINVGIDCTIYDKYGRHTQKISSLYFGIDAGIRPPCGLSRIWDTRVGSTLQNVQSSKLNINF